MDPRKRFFAFLLLTIAIFSGVYYFVVNRNNGLLTASGVIEATEITISSRTIGRVADINAEEGSTIAAGAIIATLESDEIAQTLKGAESKALVAKNEFERAKQLFSDNLISQQQYDAANSSYIIASSAYETAKIQYDNTTIKSPIFGTILTKAIEEGELATIGSPIVTVADLRVVKLIVYLPEKDLGKIKLGGDVSVSVDSYPNQIFQGKVQNISDKAEFTPKSIQTKDERVTQVFAVKIQIENPDQKLKPGMPADADFPDIAFPASSGQ